MTAGVFDLLNPNLDSSWIQWNRPFIARIRFRIRESSESSFDADPLAKPEVLSSRMTSHQHHRRKQTTMMPHSTTNTNPDHSICQRIQIWIHGESESRFGQIECGRHVIFSSCGSNRRITSVWVMMILTMHEQYCAENWTACLRSVVKWSDRYSDAAINR